MQQFPNRLRARHLEPMDSRAGDEVVTVSRPTVASALVVEPALAEALAIVGLLTTSQFHVTVAETFANAKTRLSAQPPLVLVTEVRLAEYNGLHLVLRGKSVRREMAAIVLSDVDDSVLQADAESLGATFVRKPVAGRDLVAAVFRTLSRPAGVTAPIRPPFERRKTDRRVTTIPIPADLRHADRRRALSALLQSLSK